MNWLAHAVSILMAADPGIRAPIAIGPNDEDLFEVDLIIGADPDETDPPPDEADGEPANG